MTHHISMTQPLARSEGLLVEQIGAETVLFDTESKEAHCLSPVAAAVFTAADGRSRVEDLAEVAGSSVGEGVTVEQVEEALAQLEERGLLIAPPAGITRRTMVRRTAAATAVAAPLVTSIVTPAFAATGTPQLNCPSSRCATQSEGDTYCACANTCPPSTAFPNVSNCTPFDGQPAPFYGSCECLRCPFATGPNDQGEFQSGLEPAPLNTGLALGIAVCSAAYGPNYWLNAQGQWFDWTATCSSADVAANRRYGCNNTTAQVDGACYNEPGDSSQAGLGRICE